MFMNIRKINGKEYRYLEHSFRVGRRVEKKYIYFPKAGTFNLDQFAEINNKAIESIAEQRADYIKKKSRFSFFHYGDILKNIEKRKITFQIFNNLVNDSDKKQIMNEYLRKFIVNNMCMEGATITYHDATAIDQKRNAEEGIKKMRISATNEEVLLYCQLKEAFNKLNSMHLRSANEIKKLHGRIYKNIYPFAGNFRKVHVTFGGPDNKAKTHHWKDIRKELKKSIDKFYRNKNSIYEFERILDFHIDYQRVHPFEDGNSRLGRLIMTSQFLKKGYPPLLFEAKKSAAYRSFLAKAVNNPKGQDNMMKYFYKNYKSSFNKFWKPIIEKRITEKVGEKINK